MPEAQQDRFLLYIKIGYPTASEEDRILQATTSGNRPSLEKVLVGADIIRLQSLVRQVGISATLVSGVTALVRNTRPETTESTYVREWVDWGAGPRAGQAIILTAKAHALMAGRLSVTPADIKAVVLPVLRHRILVNFRAEAEGIDADQVAHELMKGQKLFS